MYIFVHKTHDFLLVTAELSAQVRIVEVPKVLDEIIDNVVGEHAFGGVDFAVFLKLISCLDT